MEKEKVRFILSNVLRGLGGLALIVVLFVMAKNNVQPEQLAWLEPLNDHPYLLILVFFVSEVFIGIIPPELYMIWYLNPDVWIYIQKLFVLTCISYVGGILAYLLGKYLGNTPLMKRMIHSESAKQYLHYFDQYGGYLIILGATTPVPFGLVSTLSGSLGYTFGRYMTYASVRFLRFAVYGWVIWQANMI